MASHFALKPPSRSAIKAFFHPLNIHCVNQRGNTLQISLSHQPGAYSAIKIAHRGGQNHQPSREEIAQRYQRAFGSLPW